MLYCSNTWFSYGTLDLLIGIAKYFETEGICTKTQSICEICLGACPHRKILKIKPSEINAESNFTTMTAHLEQLTVLLEYFDLSAI